MCFPQSVQKMRKKLKLHQIAAHFLGIINFSQMLRIFMLFADLIN